MDDFLKKFLADAQEISLSPEELKELKEELEAQLNAAPTLHRFRSSASSLKLTTQEKSEGRAALLSFMDAHPMEGESSAIVRFFGRLSFASAAIASVFATILVGAGVSYAAEGSLPGDFLYPVKVHITEPLVSSLSIEPQGKALWSLWRVERRLKEEKALTEEREPSDERRFILQTQMEEDARGLREHMDVLPSKEKKALREIIHSKFKERENSLETEDENGGIPEPLKSIIEDDGDSEEPQEESSESRFSFSRKKKDESEKEKNNEKKGVEWKENKQEEQETEIETETETREDGKETVESFSEAKERASKSSSLKTETLERSSASRSSLWKEEKEKENKDEDEDAQKKNEEGKEKRLSKKSLRIPSLPLRLNDLPRREEEEYSSSERE